MESGRIACLFVRSRYVFSVETARAVPIDLGPSIYARLFGYCALKSGYLPLFAGYLAAIGDLDLRWTWLSVFAGGCVGDEIRFWIARRLGPKLHTCPRLVRPLSLATRLFAKHGAWYCFAYRYAKGLQTVGSLPIGLAGWRWRRFAPVNLASAAILGVRAGHRRICRGRVRRWACRALRRVGRDGDRSCDVERAGHTGRRFLKEPTPDFA